MPDASARETRFTEIFASGGAAEIARDIPVETPVALEFNGIAYAVMMATPADLADFVTGFAITEGLVARAQDIDDVDIAETDKGWIVRVQLPAEAAAPVMERARRRVSESSCGLCGIENLEQIARPLPRIAAPLAVEPQAIFTALGALRDHQHLGRRTAAVHAAAFCDLGGTILAVREDVGRHNALDKLIGGLAVAGIAAGDGVFLLSARCSYELVEKTVVAGGRALATISAPTTLAIDRAKAAGLALHVLAREDSLLRVM
ncbi:formate dehydrogenase accessory sulfurtransferase FdhD [Sphingosinicella microcystinivorans]|uniref:Sulfur carrier protein FdhD n=1 Tax=Sphingosinicella microcystinivorans TaxID=335406 RepID=A0AAD1D3I2_SPHMI|nr:formate dehydrogenase accessory sulfurtransferase FdhD [Sphingosinicella microcystinivorans]RKS88948.1 FdhD protein [Sphingosinicella microcystinivorans]BBE32703.1 sulfurtransferase FdhD [Sphingosinicella microcystinivorans]